MKHLINISNWIMNHPKQAFLAFVGICISPLIIVHVLYKINSPYEFFSPVWCAGDLIQYIAGFSAFIGTIILGTVSIIQTEKGNIINGDLLHLTLESERKSVLPYLSITYCRASPSEIALDPNCSDREAEHDNDSSKTPEILFTATPKNLVVLDSDNPNAIAIFKDLYSFNDTGYGYEVLWGDGSNKRFKIVNIGKNAAVNLTCYFYKEDCEHTHNASSLPFTLPAGDCFYVSIRFEKLGIIKGNYVLLFSYSDIYMEEYTQEIRLSILEDIGTVDLNQPQKRLGKPK